MKRELQTITDEWINNTDYHATRAVEYAMSLHENDGLKLIITIKLALKGTDMLQVNKDFYTLNVEEENSIKGNLHRLRKALTEAADEFAQKFDDYCQSQLPI